MQTVTLGEMSNTPHFTAIDAKNLSKGDVT